MLSLENFNLMTWNVTGIISSSSYLVELLNNNAIDICGISEHWLYEKNLYFLESLDNNYKSYAVSDFDLKRASNRKVGKGGVAIL